MYVAVSKVCIKYMETARYLLKDSVQHRPAVLI